MERKKTICSQKKKLILLNSQNNLPRNHWEIWKKPCRKSGLNRMRQKFYRIIRAKNKYNRFKELDMDFYQNDFNYVYMADFNTSSCSIVRSAMGSAVIV